MLQRGVTDLKSGDEVGKLITEAGSALIDLLQEKVGMTDEVMKIVALKVTQIVREMVASVTYRMDKQYS